MKQTAELLRELATRHRELAALSHNKEFIDDLLHLAEVCDAQAEELSARLGERSEK